MTISTSDFSLGIISSTSRFVSSSNFKRNVTIPGSGFNLRSGDVKECEKLPGKLTLSGPVCHRKSGYVLFSLLIAIHNQCNQAPAPYEHTGPDVTLNASSLRIRLTVKDWVCMARKIAHDISRSGLIKIGSYWTINKADIEELLSCLSATTCTYKPYSTKSHQFHFITSIERCVRTDTYSLTFPATIHLLLDIYGGLVEQEVIRYLNTKLKGMPALYDFVSTSNKTSHLITEISLATGLTNRRIEKLLSQLSHQGLASYLIDGSGDDKRIEELSLYSYSEPRRTNLDDYYMVTDSA